MRLFLGQALFGGVCADVFGDFYQTRMPARLAFGHDEAGAALFIDCGVEAWNPEVIGIVGARQAEKEAGGRPTEFFNRSLPMA